MAYNNYGGPPGSFPPQGMGAPPAFGAPPGINAPPGMAAPSPGGMQQFQPPPNMPNINFNAPVIRLGVDGPRPPAGPASDRMGADRGGREGRGSNAEPLGRGNRLGLGADQGPPRNLERQREQVRESMMAMQPPTKEEVHRTIFIGGLTEDMPSDDALHQILSSAGRLRRWTRARDAADKKCKFGFAEYEDAESLENATEILPDLELPLFNRDGTVKKEVGEDGKDDEVKKAKLLVVVDDESRAYITQWMGKKKESEDARQFRVESCREERDQTISRLINESAYASNGMNGHVDIDGDTAMGDMNGEGDSVEVLNVPLELDDELGDIPVEMRATVAEEIKAFRERSNRRDIERLRREEAVEQEERARSGAPPRVNRLASPPPGGPASSANGVPVGPRGQQGVQGAPSGPKGFRGAQLPSDYINGVSFVSGTNGTGINQEEEDAEESDEELERRRQEKRDADRDKSYQEAVRRWQNRERTRGAAQERERNRMDAERRQVEKAKEDMMVKLANWNDDEEAKSGKQLYHRDRSAWIRSREHERRVEDREDDLDREAEQREQADERRRTNEARGMADDFLGSMGIDANAASDQPAAGGFGGFKINLGNAAAKTRQAQQTGPTSKRALADVEGLLEDEEDAAAAGMKRPELKPLQDTSTLPENGQDLTDDEKRTARSQLAGEIPTDIEPLFSHPIKWDSISTSLIDSQIRPFVERKVVEYLGVQEDLIVDAVVDGVKNKTPAKDLVEELLGPLEDEAEVLVKKVWRMLVFWGECESRGLS